MCVLFPLVGEAGGVLCGAAAAEEAERAAAACVHSLQLKRSLHALPQRRPLALLLEKGVVDCRQRQLLQLLLAASAWGWSV